MKLTKLRLKRLIKEYASDAWGAAGPAPHWSARATDSRAEETPAEYNLGAAVGPFRSMAAAQRAAGRASEEEQELSGEHPMLKHSKQVEGSYQSLADAAIRGSNKAYSMLGKAARGGDSEAMAMYDAVREHFRAVRDASRPTPLSAEQEADMLEELINEELDNVIEEMRLSQGARYIDEYGMEEDFMGEGSMDEGYLEEDFFSEGYLEEDEGESLESRLQRLEDAMLG